MSGPASNAFTPDALTAYLHERIPLTRAMAVAVVEAGPERVVLSAPLPPNVNHRETAFGGSLSGIAILAGWAWAFVRLKPLGLYARIVVHESRTAFERPVDGPFEATCGPIDEAAFARFADALRRRSKARLTLDSAVLCRGEVCARHIGSYVALLPNRTEQD